jgi:dipeptidyl aminopeptidase/acylaminoacyl peptidase
MVVTPDGKPVSTSQIGQLKVKRLVWAGEDHIVVIVASNLNFGFRNDNFETESAVSLDVPSGRAVPIFGPRHGQRMFDAIWGFFGTAELDGHWYGWFGGLTFAKDKDDIYLEHGYPDLYKVDLASGDVEKVANGRVDSDEWLVSPAGSVVAQSRYSSTAGDWSVLAGDDSSKVIAAGRASFAGAGRLSLGMSPDRLLVAVPDGAGQGYVYRDLSLTGGMEKPVANSEQILYPLIDPASRLWIGVALRNDEREPVLFSPAFEARWRGVRKAFPNNIVHLESWNSDFSKLIVHTDGGDDSGTYWFVDIATHKAIPVGAEYEDVKPDDVGLVRMVSWRAADGINLRGVLTLPPGHPAKSLPLVVLPHGGPEVRDYPGFDWWVQAYASRGYAVFQPNFRGSGGYGVEFRNAGLGQWGRKMQTDISDGVADLARQGIVDPKRACIVGGSYGGYAALAGVTVQQGLYRCAVSVAGIADLAEMLAYNRERAGLKSDTMRYWKAFMGVNASTDDSLYAISPVLRASYADAPILLIHGEEDIRVPINQSERMEAALKRGGKPVEFVRIDGGDHEFLLEKSRIQMLTAAVAFVEKYNPPN